MADFFRLDSSGNISLGIDLSQRQLKAELDLDVEEATNCTIDEFKIWIEDQKFIEYQLELLADYFAHLGNYYKIDNAIKGHSLLEKAYVLLTRSDDLSRTISIVRDEKKRLIEKNLSSDNKI